MAIHGQWPRDTLFTYIHRKYLYILENTHKLHVEDCSDSKVFRSIHVHAMVTCLPGHDYSCDSRTFFTYIKHACMHMWARKYTKAICWKISTFKNIHVHACDGHLAHFHTYIHHKYAYIHENIHKLHEERYSNSKSYTIYMAFDGHVTSFCAYVDYNFNTLCKKIWKSFY